MLKNSIKYILIFLAIIIGVFVFYSLENKIDDEQAVFPPLPGYAGTSSAEKSDKPYNDIASTAPAKLEAEFSKPGEAVAGTKKSVIIQSVPFSPQAPFAEWSDPRQEDGCEEMSAIMAMHWVNNKGLSREEAKRELLAIADFEFKNYGYFKDTSVADTAERIFGSYYKYDGAEVRYDIIAEDIIRELEAGNIIIIPVDGKAVGNPNYKNGGPERHNILIKGYDFGAEEFITNDPGTRKGEDYRYDNEAIMAALRDYPSGTEAPITEKRKAMIIVKPK